MATDRGPRPASWSLGSSEDYDLTRGYAMALYGVLKNGPVAPEQHVGTSGSHRDESATLRLDGIAARTPA